MTEMEIDALLAEIPRLKCRHGFGNKEFASIEHGVTELSERRKDSCFYLGVVGEFTAGKSTLINALLGFEAVKEDILQATTCTPTIIRHGDRFDVIVELCDGHLLRYDGAGAGMRCADVAEQRTCLRNARLFIYKWTAEERYARDAKKVTICIPLGNMLFNENIAIVDTPGLNAGNSRHHGVTERAVRDICDAAVVLTDARNPCSATLMRFLEDHLVDMTENCFAVVSHIDMVRPKQRDRVVAYARSKFESAGFKFASYFGLAPFYAAHPQDSENPEAPAFRIAFKDAFSSMAKSLRAFRTRAITAKLESLLKEFLRDLVNPLIDAKKEALEREHRTLTENPLCDFEMFVSVLKNELSGVVERTFEDCDSSLRSHISEVANNVKSEFTSRINSASTTANVQALVTPQVFRSVAESSYKECVLPFLMAIRKTCRNNYSVMSQNIRNSFKELYGNLAEGMPTPRGADMISDDVGHCSMPSEMDTAGVDIMPDEDTQKGAAAMGAIIGAAVGGPVGAVVGGVIGFICSGFLGPSLSQVQSSALSQVHNIVNAWRDSVTKASIADAAKAKSALASAFDKTVEAYRKYEPAVQKLVDLHNAKKEALESEIANLQADRERFTLG